MTIHSVLIQKLLKTNAHLGRRITSDHIKPYIYGSRNATSIIDSDKTLISLRAALDFIAQLSRQNARFLFVNTNPLFDPIFDQMTQKLGYGSFTSKSNQYWKLGGFLTNSASPKKFKSRNKKLCFGPVHPPDCVFIVDSEGKSSVVKEASRLQIPIVGLVDTNLPKDVFDKITYPIVSNDSVQFVYLVCNLITKTFLLEQRNAGVPNLADLSDQSGEAKPVESNQSDDVKPLESNQSADAETLESNQSADDMEVPSSA